MTTRLEDLRAINDATVKEGLKYVITFQPTFAALLAVVEAAEEDREAIHSGGDAAASGRKLDAALAALAAPAPDKEPE